MLVSILWDGQLGLPGLLIWWQCCCHRTQAHDKRTEAEKLATEESVFCSELAALQMLRVCVCAAAAVAL